MRVLICDQETEMLERIARSFDVDLATSKATCIDLMRANAFDVLVASERLSDGSGLELLSHVATRWPDTLRVLAIEPQRLRMLRGKLSPFRLHATMAYPLDEDELERVLAEMAELLGDEEAEADEPTAAPPSRAVAPSAARQSAANAAAAERIPGKPNLRSPASQSPVRATPATTAKAVKLPQPQRITTSSMTDRRSSDQAAPARSITTPAFDAVQGSESVRPTVSRRLGGYTSLGDPMDEPVRIVERGFDQTLAPLAARAIRAREEASRPRTPAERAKLLAGEVSRKLRRLIKREE